MWRCRCDCGRECEVVGASLAKGNTRSCGCLKAQRALDLTGQRFGRLVAVEPTEKRDRDSVVWRCRCDCGNEVEVPARALTSGDRRSCGCAAKDVGSKLARDVAGQRFGKLVAVEPTEKRMRGSVVWRCRCDCGRECEVPLTALTSGHRRSCGCLAGGETGHSAIRDLTGQRFGKLVAMEPTQKRKGGAVVWKCKCDCGNICEAPSPVLVSGRKKSCGCLRGKGSAVRRAKDTAPNARDLTGQRFGRLTAVRVVGRRGTHALWECVCDCGNTCEVTTGNLSSGRTRSCGCLRSGMDPRNLAGHRFGKLIAVDATGDVEPNGESPIWRCLCDCNRITSTTARALALGTTTACGHCG